MAFEYKEEYAWLTNICLNVTDACNLACRYCFVEQHPHFMSYEVAEKAVYFILDNLEKKNKKFNREDKASITFFGGEPTLMWDEIIVPLTTWIRENNFPIDLTITTNGTLLNEERIQFLKDNNIFPLLSIDGDKETQDYNRPCRNCESSFDLVNKNIPLLLEAFPDITFRATIYAKSVSHLFENYMFAVKNNFANVFFIPDERNKWSKQEQQQLKQEIHNIFSFLYYCFNNGIEPINFSLINDTFQQMLQRDLSIYYDNLVELKVNRSCLRCGLGTTFGAISYDGKIYGCQEQPSKDNKNIFLIGNIYNGIDKKRHSKLLKKYSKKSKSVCENKKICKQCDLRRVCITSGCPSSHYDLFKKFHKNTEITCLWKQWLYEECVQLNNILVNNNNQIFKNYLNNKCGFLNNLKDGAKNG